VGRLDLYRGGMLEGVPKEERRKALESCIEAMDLEEDAFFDTEPYYYFKIGCIGSRGNIATGLLDRANYGIKMKHLQKVALETAKQGGEFEGGGIYRVFAAVRGNPKADALGLYNPAEGVIFANRAMATSANEELRPWTQPYAGAEYLENIYYAHFARVALALKEKDRAKVEGIEKELQKSLESFVSKMERVPEETYYRRSSGQLLDLMKGCLPQRDWLECIRQGMEAEKKAGEVS
jgi:hypothetical protein